jgi:cell division protein FtsB
MNAETNLWDKLTGVVIFLLFIAGLLGVAVWYLPLIHQNERLRKEILRLDAKIEKERETGKQLQNAIDALKHDPKAIERLMRERLGYAKPGETVIRFEASMTNVIR